jgi:hypothetical protein
MNLAGAKKIKRYIAKNYMTIKYKINKLGDNKGSI